MANSYPVFLPTLPPCNLPINRCPVGRENAERRILIFRTGAMGDILMGTPLLAALRKAYPTAYITWIAEYNHLDIILANPLLDEVVRWDGGFWKHRIRKIQRLPRFAFHWLRLARELRVRQFDIFISFEAENYHWLTKAVRARHAIGFFDYFPQYNSQNYEYKRYYHNYFTKQDFPAHRTDQNLIALSALGLSQPPHLEKGMILGYTADDQAQVQKLRAEAAIGEDAYVVLVPKTTWVTKNWAARQWVALGDALQARYGDRIVLLGSATERDDINTIAGQMRQTPVVWAGNLNLRQAAAAIAGAKLLVSGDTGPMHMAAALGTPFIALFGATKTEMLAPLVGNGTVLAHPIPCGPCDYRECVHTDHPVLCMDLITVEQVLFAAHRLLSQSQPLPVLDSP